MRKTLDYFVQEAESGKRVDALLVGVFGLSRRAITGLKQVQNGIMCNGQKVTVRHIVESGDHLQALVSDQPEQILSVAPVAMQLDILYEDQDYLAVNKPWGMPVHPSIAHGMDSLGNGVMHYLLAKGEASTYRPITRLDKDTSGIVLIAKSGYAQSQLSSERMCKTYLAWVGGTVPREGKIELPIAREVVGGIKRCVRSDGKYACTEYRVLERAAGNSLVLVGLKTGRTHQIRVHFAHLGYPLLGDRLYGGDCSSWQRQALHAYKLSFEQPLTKVQVEIVSNFKA